MKQSKYIIFDNKGETLDRYTIIERKTGDILGSSETGTGFFMYCGNVADNYWATAYGASWRRGIDEKLLNKRIKYAISELLKDCKHLGQRIELKDLDKNVQMQIENYFRVV